MTGKKRTDAEMFDAILDQAELDAAFEEATEEVVAKHLAEAGYTEEKLAEMARKHLPPASHSAPLREAPAKVVPISSARRWSTRFVVGGMGLSFAAAMGLTVIVMLTALPAHPPPEPTVQTPTTAAAANNRAKALRAEARELFFVHDYLRTLEDLDDAKRYDPEGDTDPGVVNLRAELAERLRDAR